ncbi:TIGR04283 family arsenosugar biosynthesis glycosyltransferase [Flavobacterium sp.]|uniref:TIGR04283 family arsenosugar biosynthesis glycosyltransferase n=1 Tax=Flavobacterium sp. TaxID=239 RepID=UPI003750A85B
MTISIIIPVLNEENYISNLLDYLLEVLNPEFTKEIIVVDGGSSDATLEILNNYPKIKIYNSQKGRAIQMNAASKNATSEILYFLHSDTFPPKNFDEEIINQIKKGNLSGCFKMKFDNNHIVLKVSQWFTQFNHKSCRGGDQSLFVERNLFKKLNGFNEKLTIYEDNELIHRLYKNSNFTVIQKPVTTSSRKYLKNGVWRLQFHFMMIHIKFLLGLNQENLTSYYQKNIQ